MKYDPDVAPDAAEWLDSDEGSRLAAVRQYHKRARAPVGASPDVHAGIHVAVENQLAEGHPAATGALSRLVAEGLDRHEAVHAIGAVLAAEMFDVMKLQTPHDPDRYARRLQTLTASRWRAGSW